MPEGQDQAGNGGEGQDPNASGQGQDPAQGQGTGQDPNPQGQDPQGTGSDQFANWTPEQYQQALKDLRAENAQRRTKASELEQKVQEYEKANMTEAERREKETKDLQNRNQELENALLEEKATNRLTAAAGTKGFINPAAAAAMIRPQQVTWDDQGNATNISDLLEQLVKDHPYLVQRSSANGGEGRGSGAGAKEDMNAQIRSAAGY